MEGLEGYDQHFNPATVPAAMCHKLTQHIQLLNIRKIQLLNMYFTTTPIHCILHLILAEH
jgi:hypothetical protein